jgi:hypothetical protein
MPARLHPLPYAATQPAASDDVDSTGEAAATEPDGSVGDPDVYSGLVARILRFAARRHADPHAALDAIVVGKYVLLDLVDEGAMGLVCTALEPNFGTVALKFPKSAPSPLLRERVLQEGKLLARVHHTNVLRVYEIGQCEDTLFIATEYIDGASLRAWQTSRPWRDIVRAYQGVARGLAAIHDTGVVHQDIKPDNIRIDRNGVVRVLDFGLAHLESRLHDLAVTAPERRGDASPATFYRGGTPGYMAPEQYQPGVLADARADQFAFCAALWEALHGVIPYPSDVIASTVAGAERLPLGPPRALTTKGPRWLRKLLQRGLSEKKADRFPDMHALVAAIDRRLHRRWWPALTLAAAAATAAALATARMSGPDLPMCEAPDLAIASAWSPDRDQSLAVLAAAAADPSAIPVVDSMRAELTAYTRRWSAAHAAMCQRAHDAGSRVPADEREPCFTQRRHAAAQVAAAIEQFATTHQRSARAPWAEQRLLWMQQLDPIDDCLAPALPYARAAASDLDPTLDAAITAALAADTDAARLGYQRVLTLAARDADPGDAWHRARARLGLAVLDPSHADAHADLLAALRDAEISGDTLLAADVLALLIYVAADGADDPARALDFVPAALGKLTALGLDHGRRARDLHLSAALAAVQAGLLEVADEHLAHVLAIPGDTAILAREDLIRGQLAERRGDLPLALTRTRAALTAQLAVDGPGTRPVADTMRTLGALQFAARDPDAATTLLTALQIYEDRLGPDSADALTVRLSLATLHYDADDLARAREHAAPISRALADAADLPPTWRPLAELLLGNLTLDAAPAEAAGHYQRALLLLEARDVPEAIVGDRWLARLGLARAQLAQGHTDVARSTLAPLLAAQDGDAAAYREHALATQSALDRRSAASR